MNRKIIAWCSFGLIASLTQVFAALDDGKFYVAARGGAVWVGSTNINGKSITLDPGYAVSGALGYEMALPDLGNPDHPIRLRLEIESGYGSASSTQGNISYSSNTVPIMANAIIDYYFTQKLYVYGGIGGGLAIQDVSGGAYSENHTNYAVQARGGAGYKLNEALSIEAGYRIFCQKFENPLSQMFEAGIVLRF